ncbi:MAG: LysR substrate-binding domain-containing protein [Acidimicrobiia bacterium]
MELRHLDTLLAVTREGSFTAAADSMRTVQSNVSEQIRQLEHELGAELVVRGRKGARLTDCGSVVVERARRIRRELDAMRADLSMLRGLAAGSASLGVVGTASRWLVPALVVELRDRASGVRLRISEAASERLSAEVLDHQLAQAVVTEPVLDARLAVEHLLEEPLVGLAPASAKLPAEPVSLEVLTAMPLVLPPRENPLRTEVETAIADAGLTTSVPIEVEGVRLIVELVAAGAGASVLPETAVPASSDIRRFEIAGLPPRRLALITGRDTHLSLADRSVREAVRRLVASQREVGVAREP